MTGEVRTPGAYAYDDDMTIFTAISLAGGITAKGSNTRITITRLVNGQPAGNRREAGRYTQARRSGHRQAASPVRIVFLNPSGELGGAETALARDAGCRSARPARRGSSVSSPSAPGRCSIALLGSGFPAVPLDFPPSLARLGEWGRRGSIVDRVLLGVAGARAAFPALSYASTAAPRARHISIPTSSIPTD